MPLPLPGRDRRPVRRCGGRHRGVWTYRVSDDAAAVTEYTGSAAAVTIPSELGGYPVTQIGYRAFYGCTSLQSITIPDTVTEIGYRAFYNCTNLASVALSKSLETLGQSAFSNCTDLTSIHIPKSLVSAGSDTFSNTGLKQVTFEAGVTQIPGYLFSGCASLETIVIPDTVTQIGNSAFSGCTSLQSVAIPDSVIEIGDSAFYGCTSLSYVNLPKYLETLNSWAFRGCISLTEITIPKSLKEVGDFRLGSGSGGVFENTGLKNVLFEKGITTIPASLFYKCGSLETFTIPDTVTQIGEFCF